jgi:hypothetical protein
MRKSEQVLAWVVYKKIVNSKTAAMSAVCEQREWEAMEQERPGYHTLVRAGITNEAEAEMLARDTSGYVAPALKPRTGQPAVEPVLGYAQLLSNWQPPNPVSNNDR